MRGTPGRQFSRQSRFARLPWKAYHFSTIGNPITGIGSREACAPACNEERDLCPKLNDAAAEQPSALNSPHEPRGRPPERRSNAQRSRGSCCPNSWKDRTRSNHLDCAAMHTRIFEQDGKTYVLSAAADASKPTRVWIEATANGESVPIPGLPDGVMSRQPPHDYEGLLKAVERLLREPSTP